MIVDQLAQISESQPDAAKSKATLKANYRFVDHPQNSPEAILNAHHQASIARTAEHMRVVLAQDTTVIDLTKPSCQVQGAEPLESEDKRGVFLHPLYAMTEEGLPLGIVDEVIWSRDRIHTDLTQKEKQATDGGPLPDEPLTIRDFMLMIAELGGWQRKKSQGPPGSMTIWRGLRRMEAYADAFQAFQKAKSRCGG